MSSPLPHGLMGVRDDYKRCTKTVLQWLTTNGSPNPRAKAHNSLRDLLRLAQNIKECGIKLPHDIASAFRQTISLRSQMSKWYEQTFSGVNDLDIDMSTARHEKFTSTLQVIYDHLSAMGIDKRQPLSSSRANSPQLEASPNPDIVSTSNRFAALFQEYQEATPSPKYSPTTKNDEAETAAAECRPQADMDHKENNLERVEDDILGEFFDAYTSLINLDALLSMSKKSCSRAARQEIPFLAAAATCRFAWHCGKDDIEFLGTSPWARDVKTFATLVQSCKAMKRVAAARSEENALDDAFWSLGVGLLGPLHILEIHRFPRERHDESSSKNPADLIPLWPDSDKDIRCFQSMLTGALNHNAVTKPFEEESSFHLKQIQLWAENPECHYRRIACAASLRFVLECHRGYLWPYDDPSGIKLYTKPSIVRPKPINPRLIVLKFFQEVGQTFKALELHPAMANCCNVSLACECGAYREVMENTIKDRNFELYFQSPVIAAERILFMQQFFYFVGMKVVNHRHHVASVLHAYNALRYLNEVQPIPVLDEFCSIFEDSIFLGSLPVSNFDSRYVRYQGGKVEYGHDKDSHDVPAGMRRPWRMRATGSEINDDDQHCEVNYKRFSPSTFDCSLFRLSIDPHDYQKAHWFWARVYGFKNWMVPSKDDCQKLAELLDSCTMADHPLSHVEAALVSELSGEKETCEHSVGKENISQKLADARNAGADNKKLHNGHTVWYNPSLPASPRVDFWDPHREVCGCGKPSAHEKWEKQNKKRGTGLLPFARINYGAIWLACATVMLEVNDAPDHGHDPALCKCMVHSLLSYADYEALMNAAGPRAKEKHQAKLAKARQERKSKPRTVAQELMRDFTKHRLEKSKGTVFEAWKKAFGKFGREKTMEDFMWKALL